MKKLIAVLLALSMAISLCACKSSDYKEAQELYDDERYSRARKIFVELGDYKDSAEMVLECDYQQALILMDDGDLSEARELFLALGDYEDSTKKASECGYQLATAHMDEGEFDQALTLFQALGDYKDSVKMITACNYQLALACLDAGEYAQAHMMFQELGDYEDSQERVAHAARGMLINYVMENKITPYEVSDSCFIHIIEDDGALLMAYVFEITGIINMNVRIGAQIQVDGTALMVGTEKCSSYAADWSAEGASVWDISKYHSGDAMTWDQVETSGYNANGKVYASESSLMIRLFHQAAVEKTTAHLAQVLEDSGLGLTMADIGFTSY